MFGNNTLVMSMSRAGPLKSLQLKTPCGQRASSLVGMRQRREKKRQWKKNVSENSQKSFFFTYMKGGPLFPVQGLGDKHVAADWIYVVNATRGLISPCSRDAVADTSFLILI